MNNSLSLKKELYTLESILETVDAYKKLCSCKIDDDGDEYRVSFNRCLYDVSMTMQEFENYLISKERKNEY